MKSKQIQFAEAEIEQHRAVLELLKRINAPKGAVVVYHRAINRLLNYIHRESMK